MGIGAVLSVVRSFELNTRGLLMNPISSEEFEKAQKTAGLQWQQIPAVDFQTISLGAITMGVEFIKRNVDNGIPVYIHCKAGMARFICGNFSLSRLCPYLMYSLSSE